MKQILSEPFLNYVYYLKGEHFIIVKCCVLVAFQRLTCYSFDEISSNQVIVCFQNDQDWDVSDEDPDSDDDFDLPDSEDDYDTKKPKARQQGKGFRKLSSGLDRKSAQASSRQKRKPSYQEDFSEDDSDNEIDEGFRSLPRRGTTLGKNNGRSTNNIGQSSEVRSSTRSVRKVSYVESEDSEEIDDGRNRKTQKV